MAWELFTCDPVCDIPTWLAVLIEMIGLGITMGIVLWELNRKMKRGRYSQANVVFRLGDVYAALNVLKTRLNDYYNTQNPESKSNILEIVSLVNSMIKNIKSHIDRSSDVIKPEIVVDVDNFCSSVPEPLLKLDNKQDDLAKCTNLINRTDEDFFGLRDLNTFKTLVS